MDLRREALDSQGYIINQKKTDNLRFGWTPSDKNGCGWIAAYNFLKAMDKEKEPEEVLKKLEKALLPGLSRFGLNFIALGIYLRAQGIPLEFTVRQFHTQRIAEEAPAGIILYRAGKTNHFAAFRRLENGKLRFYGAVSGRENHDMSMAEFFYDYVKFPLTLTITAK